MVFSAILGEFIKTTPASGYVQAVLERMFDAAKLDRFFVKHSSRPYTRQLPFSGMVGLMEMIVLRMRKSINASCQPLRGQLGASLTAVHDKLSSTEPEVGGGRV